jgi:hypothetical protein
MSANIISIDVILDQLQSAGLGLSAEGDQLKAQGPKSAMTPALAQHIRARKDELVALLSQPKSPTQAEELSIACAYDTKATIAGGKPPLQQVQELQDWLATIDWRYGLRCGISGQQCRVCKGLPCRGSKAWQPSPGDDAPSGG